MHIHKFSSRLLLIAVFALNSFVGAIAQAPASKTTETKSKAALQQEESPVDIVVQGALDWELQPLMHSLQEKREIQIASWTFWRGKIGNKSVVISRTEMGPINAVAATTLAITTFRPKLIINQGSAGANDPDLKVFDIVVGESTVDYGAFRTEHGDAGTGANPARWIPMTHGIRVDGKDVVRFKSFPGDEAAMAVALKTKYEHGRVRKGVIGSAYEYNREIDRLLWVRKTFGTDSEDMESAYVAGTAIGFKTRFLAIRIISDSEFYAPELQRVSGEYCAAFVVDVIKNIEK